MSKASELQKTIKEIKRRSKRKKKSTLTTSNLRGTTKKLRTKQNKTRKVQIFSLNALPRNKQVIAKSQVFALTPGNFPYQQTLIFSNVTFVDVPDRARKLKVSLGQGEVKYMSPLSLRRHPLQVRCTCFTGDTLIPLMDGTIIPIKDLIGKKEFFVYSYDLENKKVVTGRANNCRLTEKKAKIVEVTLDNGETVRCTPDHMFLLMDGSYKQVKDIQPDESLQALYRRESEKDVDKLVGYEMYFEDGSWKYTHRLSDKYNWDSYLPDEYVRHHADFTKLNNSPKNIVRIHKDEHLRFHGKHARARMLSNNPMKDPAVVKVRNDTCIARGVYKDISNRMKNKNPMKGPVIVNKMLTTAFKNGSYVGAGYNFRAKAPDVRKKMSDIKKRQIASCEFVPHFMTEEGKAQVKAEHRKKFKDGTHQLTKANQKKLFKSYERVTKWLSKLPLMERVKITQEDASKLGYYKLETLRASFSKLLDRYEMPGVIFELISYGKNRGTYVTRTKPPLNHKIVSIKDAGYEDVYCITVEEYENFIISTDGEDRFGSGVFVHNCPDFRWTWNWYDATKSALTGPRVPPYKRQTPPPPKGRPYRNPIKVPGMCKHLIAVTKVLQARGLLK